MTDEAIRIKVAEAMGWTGIRGETGYPTLRARELGDYQALPNYPESLDACAELEKTIKVPHKYNEQLELVVLGYLLKEKDSVAEFTLRCATARQRCIAYLRVKGILP